VLRFALEFGVSDEKLLDFCFGVLRLEKGLVCGARASIF
jgi:hypothetical protein